MVSGCFGVAEVEDKDQYRIKGIFSKEQLLLCFATPCYTMWTMFDGSQIPPTTGPKAHLKSMQELIREDAVSWYSVIAWPMHSPDLNSTELLQVEPSHMVGKKRPSSHSNLCEVLQKEWSEISSDYLKQQMARGLQVCKAVIDANGHI